MKKIMNVEFSNIVWDTDGEAVNIPNMITIETDCEDIAQEGADILSDRYGYCVTSFDFEILL